MAKGGDRKSQNPMVLVRSIPDHPSGRVTLRLSRTTEGKRDGLDVVHQKKKNTEGNPNVWLEIPRSRRAQNIITQGEKQRIECMPMIERSVPLILSFVWIRWVITRG